MNGSTIFAKWRQCAACQSTWTHSSPQPKRHLDQLSGFSGITIVQTDRRRYSVTCVRNAAMRLKNYYIVIKIKGNHSEYVLSLHASTMGKRGTFLDNPGDLRPRLQVKGHRESASRSGQNAATHHRGWQSGVSFT